MQEKTKYLKLPFQFDEKKLIYDLSLILESKWIPHFNSSVYIGDWKVIPLYADKGDDRNIFAYPTSNTIISETAILKVCNYFQEVIKSFKCPILTARILRLGAGAKIRPHRDHHLGYENGNFRLHIPIITNLNVHFVLDDFELTMNPGECWYTNVNYTHSVQNLGESDRIHLVIDGERNKWSDNLFFSLAPEESFDPISEDNDSPETVKRIIEELKRHKEPINNELINELKLKLNNLKIKNP
jgi:hypothetical protein